MKISFSSGGKNYAAELSSPRDISIAVRFDGKGLAAFGAPPPKREAYQTKDFTGEVSKGGSCNCDTLTFSAHLHGTHTECVGHITDAPMAVCESLKDALIPVTLITVAPQGELIGEDILKQALAGGDKAFFEGLIIRTLPNGADKKTRHYDTAPYFSSEAMRAIKDVGVKHLLVDLPSIDRMDDDALPNHRIFWGVGQGSQAAGKNPSASTVTELVYVPDDIADGKYLLNLQIAPLMSDAAPSRPLLYEIKAA